MSVEQGEGGFRITMDLMLLDRVLQEVQDEMVRASHNFAPFNSDHEAFAVAKEEFDEAWDAVKLNGHRHPERSEQVHKEVVQAAAMCLRWLYDRARWEVPRT